MKRKVKLAVGAVVMTAVAVGLVAALGGEGKPRAGALRLSTHALAATASAARESTSAAVTTASFGPNVVQGTFDGVSPAVSSLPQAPVTLVDQLNTRDFENLARSGQAGTANDPAVQSTAGSGSGITAPIGNFDGMCSPAADVPSCQATSPLASTCGCLPPDTNGEVGAAQYVQVVNSNFAVFSKSGQLLKGSTEPSQLWQKAGGECKAHGTLDANGNPSNHDDGDVVVVYDQLAQRWLLTQFIANPDTSSGEQYGECVAVSTSSDATGSYYLYTFLFGTSTFYDYPHFGVWPDAYYMTANGFDAVTGLFVGGGAFAFERAAMLQGKPARAVFFQESTAYGGQLPADLDGLRPPPKGTPGLFAEVDDPNTVVDTANPFAMRLWKFKVNWTNPSKSSFGSSGDPNYTLPVDSFVRPQCVYGDAGTNCNPQFETAEQLDTIGDRIMFRLAYRNFGSGRESLVLNHTVVANAANGIRWYEVRNPFGRNSAQPTIYQQGTYAPTDGIWRWMGSVAMDKRGDIALGYSGSSPADFPSLRYTGRLATDSPGQMTQAEQVAFTGTGPQTQAEGRWGDYSDLTVDPADDCTFYFTSEYLVPHNVLLGRWATRVVSFKFPGCT